MYFVTGMGREVCSWILECLEVALWLRVGRYNTEDM